MTRKKAVSSDKAVDSVAVESVPVEPVIEDTLFNLFEIAEKEVALKAGQDIASSPKQHCDPFNRAYFRAGNLGTPFKVNLVLSIARHMMFLQDVEFIPIAVVKVIAKELKLDLRMQGRSAFTQVKAQIKNLDIGSVQEVEIKQGEQVASLSAIVLNPANIDKLEACRFSVLS